MAYSPIPYTNGATATLALGQTSLTTCSIAGPSAKVVGAYCPAPIGLWTDGQRLAIGDPGNNRVLIFNSIAAILQRGTNAPAADVVVGQATMTSNANPGSNPNAYTLYQSCYLTSDGTQLIVNDLMSHRTLIYDPFPTSNRPAATHVLGQSTFTTGTSGSTAASLYYPQGLLIAQDYLFVGDHSNARYQIFAGP